MNPSWKRNYLRYKAFLLSTVNEYRKKAEMKVYLELLLSLVTISVFSVFALKPTLLTIVSLDKEIKSKEVTLSQMNEKIQNLNQAKEKYDAEIERIKLLKIAIPNDSNPDYFFRQIEGLSTQQAVTVLSLSTDGVTILGDNTTAAPASAKQPEGPAKAEVLSFNASLTSNYTSLVSFLAQAENFRRPITINSLIIDSREGEEEGVLNLNIQGTTPYYKGIQ